MLAVGAVGAVMLALLARFAAFFRVFSRMFAKVILRGRDGSMQR